METATENKVGYKKTKLGWIPEEWSYESMRSIVLDYKSGANIKSSEFTKDSSDQQIEVLPKSGLKYGGIVEVAENNRQFIPEIIAKKYKNSLILPGELAVVLRDLVPTGPNIGLIAKNTSSHSYIMAQGVYSLSFKPSIDQKFIAQVSNCNWYRKLMKRTLVGSTQVHIGVSDFFRLKVILPPLSEQQKISAILSTWDKAIDKLSNLITEKEALKKGLMQQLLTGKKRFPGFTDEWKEVKLGDIGDVISGLTYSPKDIDEDGVLVLRSSNVQNRRLTFDDNVYIKPNKYNPVQENDILICVRNGSRALIGKSALIDKKTEGVAFGAFMTIFRSDDNNFLFHLFDSSFFHREVHRNLGATINSINGGNLKKFKMPFPSKEERNTIASALSAADKEIETLNKELNALKEQKRGLMQKLLTGEVRVKID